jgi:hypothetical protein
MAMNEAAPGDAGTKELATLQSYVETVVLNPLRGCQIMLHQFNLVGCLCLGLTHVNAKPHAPHYF